MKTLDLCREYARISSSMYSDIEQRVEAVSISMALISLCVHHRMPIFGEDENACANYILITHQMASDLTKSIAESLPYATAFDFSPNREDNEDHMKFMAMDVNSKLQSCTKGLLRLAENGEILTDLIPDIAPVEDARNCFHSFHSHLQDMQETFNKNASDIKTQATAIGTGIENLTPDFRKEFGNDWAILRFVVILFGNHSSMADKHLKQLQEIAKPTIP